MFIASTGVPVYTSVCSEDYPPYVHCISGCPVMCFCKSRRLPSFVHCIDGCFSVCFCKFRWFLYAHYVLMPKFIVVRCMNMYGFINKSYLELLLPMNMSSLNMAEVRRKKSSKAWALAILLTLMTIQMDSLNWYTLFLLVTPQCLLQLCVFCSICPQNSNCQGIGN